MRVVCNPLQDLEEEINFAGYIRLLLIAIVTLHKYLSQKESSFLCVCDVERRLALDPPQK